MLHACRQKERERASLGGQCDMGLMAGDERTLSVGDPSPSIFLRGCEAEKYSCMTTIAVAFCNFLMA